MGEKQKPLIIDQVMDGVRLRGELGPFINGRQILFRCVKEAKGKDRIRTWLRHLFSSAFHDQAMETRFYSMDKKFLCLEPLPVDSARSIISNLVSLYQQGMRMPLPFFPESSYAFALHQPQPSPIEEASDDEGAESKGVIEARKKSGFLESIIKAKGKILPINFVFGRNHFKTQNSKESPVRFMSLLLKRAKRGRRRSNERQPGI